MRGRMWLVYSELMREVGWAAALLDIKLTIMRVT